VERAVRADLLALRPAFEEKLRQQQRIAAAADDDSPSDDNKHAATGNAFAAFKDVFGSNRVAMLNRGGSSGLLPTKCDRNSYSQMLYSVCLSLTRKSIRDHNLQDGENKNNSLAIFLQQAAYSVFLLYALYETNPLPRVPTPEELTREEYLALTLPVGQQSREHSNRIIYRRAFRTPIRIDAEHYGYLLQLRDLAKAGRCQCAAAASLLRRRKRTKMEVAAATAVHEGDDGRGDAWACDCAVATDLGIVLDRLLSSNMLEFSAYTGPCGLEGLAGHADYRPFPSSSLPASTAPAGNDSDTGRWLDGAAPKPPAPFESSSGLEKQLKEYVSDRSAIRLPALRPNMPQKEKRVRGALNALFATKSQTRSEDPLLNMMLSSGRDGEHDDGDEDFQQQQQQKRIRLQRRHVSFGTVIIHDGGATEKPSVGSAKEPTEESLAESNGMNKQHADEFGSQQPPSYELIIPNSVSTEQQTILQRMVETLLDRDESLLLLGQQGGTPSSIRGSARDDVSTLGTGMQSTAGSTVTNVGRTALQNLLSQVESPAAAAAAARKTEGPPSRVAPGDFFLTHTTAGNDGEVNVEDDDDDSQLSGLSSEDEIDHTSVAASRVGEKALQELLSLGKRRSRKRAAAKPNVHSSDEDESEGEFSDDDDEDDDAEEASVAASRIGGGKGISRNAAKNGEKGMKKPATASKRVPKGKDKVDSEDDADETTAMDDQTDGSSVAASQVGQKAIQDLLRTALGGTATKRNRRKRNL